MPLDHYISQVHLKNFYSPNLKEQMYAIKKSDPLRQFTTSAKSVCRIENGSTNSYLQEERAIEDFLKLIEPKYNRAIEKLKTGDIDVECIFTVAGFVAYVLTCSPAGMRIQSKPLKSGIEDTYRIIDSKGMLPAPLPELGGESLTELINSGKLLVKVDPKYSQAMGITSILSLTNTFGNSTWEILINSFEDNPFFTSDFPISFENIDPQITNKIIPLSPDLAIRIIPDLAFKRYPDDFSFLNFRYAIRKLNREESIGINRLIVRCAESIVFFRDNYQWIPKFVNKNAAFLVETKTYRMPSEEGTFLFHSVEVVKTR